MPGIVASMNARWTPRWWHWLLFSTVVVALMLWAVLFTLRMSGRAEYQLVVADLRAKGKAATIDEFIARAPSVDVARQEAWHRWSQAGVEYPPSAVVQNLKPDHWIAYVYGETTLPSELLKEFEDHRRTMQLARDLLQDPRLLVSTYGSLAQDLPPGKRMLPHTAAIRMPNLLTTRALASWLHHAACIEADPRPALDDLDRFHRALSRPASLIDAMIWTAISAIRNDAYVHLALLDRLPDENRRAWLGESCGLIDGVADGFAGERLLFNDSWARLGEDTSFIASFRVLRVGTLETGFSTAPADEWEEWLSFRWLYSGPWTWATIHHDCAVTAELEAHISARLRGERSDPVPDWLVIRSRYRGFGAVAIPNLVECGITALEAEARHRMYRIAVMLLTDLPHQELPADSTGLAKRLGGSDWLSPIGDRLHVSYELLSADRFRLAISPTSPVPNFDAPGRLAYRSKAFGAPASAKPLVTDRCALELRLPQRLRRVP